MMDDVQLCVVKGLQSDIFDLAYEVQCLRHVLKLVFERFDGKETGNLTEAVQDAAAASKGSKNAMHRAMKAAQQINDAMAATDAAKAMEER